MKSLVVVSALIALTLTTGFTCSKNAPEQAAPADQTQMAAPAAAPAEAPAEAPAPPPAPAPSETK